MARLARVGFIVNDIERCWPAYVGVHLLVSTPITNRLTRHDGPASVSRAFTAYEWPRMAAEAGVRGAVSATSSGGRRWSDAARGGMGVRDWGVGAVLAGGRSRCMSDSLRRSTNGSWPSP